MANTLAQAYLRELHNEEKATRACLQRIPENLWEYKPHPKSMTFGYLALLVAEIPLWLRYMVREGTLDLATFDHTKPKTNAELVAHFEANLNEAKASLEQTTDEALQAPFELKSNGAVLYTSPKLADIATTLNHWVHHRGQLTIYMRLNDIAVPSLYGPSADDRQFTPPQ